MLELKNNIIQELEDIKARDIKILDVSCITVVTDYMIIATGTSNTHLNAISDRVTECAKDLSLAVSIEGGNSADWILLDIGDIIVHAMLSETREFYQLEKFWSFQELNNIAARAAT